MNLAYSGVIFDRLVCCVGEEDHLKDGPRGRSPYGVRRTVLVERRVVGWGVGEKGKGMGWGMGGWGTVGCEGVGRKGEGRLFFRP